ncbi:amidohydrolase family protein [Roseibium polysiphoniae]|uniref:Amidohydrolase family protein n=1 Tax=Roseibium polysiphoniae TaxID=2571221 RepID=A0ABR9C7E0_9HYPH|nr:amidohydrolase family protein [Roseibium polysiphoniae]MBD8875819.1 amidohydrolase family protein [Roseibium polysiphoniae]
MSDLIIRNVRTSETEGLVDLLIVGNRIEEIGAGLVAEAPERDGNGALLVTGFVESHIHLDKACILDRCRNETGTLEGAIASVGTAKRNFTASDVYDRGKQVLDKAIVQGTNAMRTHVEIDPGIGLAGFDAVLALKKDYAWAVDLQICVFPQEGLTNYPGTQALLEEALTRGGDLLGGCPYTDSDPNAQISILFEMAESHGVDLDFHLDFDLDPSWRHLDEIARKTIAHGWQGRVAIGHVTKLSALPHAELMDVVALLKDAGIALTVLPATDLFLMGRGEDHLVPRGVAPAQVFHEHGVCCTVATNNVLNPFTPYGDCSLPRMANLFANVQQLSTESELQACFDMVTDIPRRLINQSRRIAVGEAATFVALPALTGGQAVAEIARPLWGFKDGKMTFEQAPAELFQPA